MRKTKAMGKRTTSEPGTAVRGWLAYWRYKALYHRYTVEGLDRLVNAPASLVVGYHGRPAAWDVCMLTVALYDRLGYLPHAVLNPSVDYFPGGRALLDALGFVAEDGDAVAEIVRRGEHLVVTPGAATEGSRTWMHRYRVKFGEHLGYLRLALRHRLPIVPVGSSGADDAYIGVVDGLKLAKLLGMPRGWSLWIGFGPFGVFPFSPAFPVRMRQIIGEPIEPWADGEVDPEDREALLRIHRRVTAAVQDLLDRARECG